MPIHEATGPEAITGGFPVMVQLRTDLDEAGFVEQVQRQAKEGCRQLDLDSGVQRHAAHRFYFREGMRIPSFHFALDLGDAPG